MKKLIFLFLLCPFLLSAQEETSKKMFVGVFGAPQLNGITKSYDHFPGHNVLELGFSAGINWGVNLTDKINLRTGLGYSHIRYQYIQEGRMGGAGTTSEYVHRLRYHDIHIPVILQYGRKFFGTIGTEFSYQFGSENTERFINEGNGNVTMLNRLPAEGNVNLAIQLGMGYSIALDNKMELLLEPVLKYYLKSYVIENSNLNCIGLKATLAYEL